MKRLIFSIVSLLAASCVLSFAQIKEGNNFEAGGGYNFSSFNNFSGNRYGATGPGVYFEYRYESESCFYVGGQVDYKYAFGDGDHFTQEGVAYRNNYHRLCLEGLFGYTFLSDQLACPFLGVGLGVGSSFLHRTDSSRGLYFYGTVTPRVGVQIWRFRLTAEFDFLFSRLNIGWGGPGFSFGFSSTARAITSIASLNLGFVF